MFKDASPDNYVTLKTISSSLVSVVVITYNSASYLIETLESIKDQSYQDLELIISDDCSGDNTIDLCREWLKEHNSRFTGVKIIETEKNSGVSANVNRGFNAASGAWIKLTAGDDILLPNLVEDNMNYILANPEAGVVATDILYFKEKGKEHVITGKTSKSLLNHPQLSAKDQYELYLRNYSKRINSLFISREAYFKAGGCDESFPLKEDGPLIGRLLRSGTKFHYLESTTFKYRLHENSITGKNVNKKIYTKFHSDANTKFYKDYLIPNVSFFERLLHYYHILVITLTSATFLNSRNAATLTLNKVMMFPVDFFANRIKQAHISQIAEKYNLKA